MTGMDELVTWLRAQLDEDERSASGSGDLGWLTYRREDGSIAYTIPAALAGDGTWVAVGAVARDFASAIVVHRESERLAEVDAKRLILDLHTPVPTGPTWRPGPPQCEHCASLCHSHSGIMCEDPDAPYPCLTVRLLALPFAGREGYREDWGLAP